eukprot:NODE_244_length_13037_cov_0.560442.p9 type:complete len:120 gc:universal NODE_244_length_13037_cov_0.560442:1694-2053(+)
MMELTTNAANIYNFELNVELTGYSNGTIKELCKRRDDVALMKNKTMAEFYNLGDKIKNVYLEYNRNGGNPDTLQTLEALSNEIQALIYHYHVLAEMLDDISSQLNSVLKRRSFSSKSLK